MRLKLNVDMAMLSWGSPEERPTGRCSLCETPFTEDDVPLSMWSSEGWGASLCDACADKLVEVEKEGMKGAGDG
jgi:hypothetical protein